MPMFCVQIKHKRCSYVDTDDDWTPQGLLVRTVEDVISVVQMDNPKRLGRFELSKLSLHLPEIDEFNGHFIAGYEIPLDTPVEDLVTLGHGNDEKDPFVLRINQLYITVSKELHLVSVFRGPYVAEIEWYIPCPSIWYYLKYNLGLIKPDVNTDEISMVREDMIPTDGDDNQLLAGHDNCDTVKLRKDKEHDEQN